MCPNCGAALVTFELDAVETDHCLECGGTWLDAGELERIVESAGGDPAPLRALLEAEKGEKHGKRTCVRCRAKLRLATVRGVEVDRCPLGHGIWFDKGEIAKVAQSFHGGAEGAVAGFLGDLFKAELKGGSA
jgi:Zn-finger nucleic acid-binding protein